MSSRLRRLLIALACVGAAAGLTACGSSGSGGGKSSGKTWIQGLVTPKGDAGFEYMAQAQHFFAQQGLHVEYKTFTGNVQLTQALLAGSLDSISSAPGSVMSAVQKGGDLKIIGSTTPKLIDVVISKSSITSLAGLKGKTIGTSAPGALPDEAVKAMLASKGIAANQVQTVNAGGDAQRFDALLHGRIDAAEESPDFVPQIKKAGGSVHVLARIQDVVPFFTHHLLIVSGSTLRKRPGATGRFLAAEMEGVSYALHHRRAELALAAKESGESASSPALAYDFNAIKTQHAASPTAQIPTADIAREQSFRISAGLQKGRIDLGKLIDGSPRQQALKRVAGKIPEVPAH